jgi:hypothetical protein
LLDDHRPLVVAAALAHHVAAKGTSDSSNGCGGAINTTNLGRWGTGDWVLDARDARHAWDVWATASEAKGEGRCEDD